MTDTAILEEVHQNLGARRMDLGRRYQALDNLLAHQQVFRQAWEQRDIATMETVRVPRITGNLGSPYATVRMPIAVGIDKPVVVHPVIAQIGKAVDRFYLQRGRAPEMVVMWAMDILLLGGPARIEIKTDIVSVDVELCTESQLQGNASKLICDAREI